MNKDDDVFSALRHDGPYYAIHVEEVDSWESDLRKACESINISPLDLANGNKEEVYREAINQLLAEMKEVRRRINCVINPPELPAE